MPIITIGGDPGSGKSTLARQLAALLDIPHVSAGDLFRQAAKDSGMTVEQFTKAAEQDAGLWERKVDPYQEKLPGLHESFVIDSRLGFHFLPQSVKIYLKVDVEEAALRLMGDKREGERWHTAEEGVRQLKERQESERKRFRECYGVDHTDEGNYDFVVDTTHLNAEEKLGKVVRFLRENGVDVPE